MNTCKCSIDPYSPLSLVSAIFTVLFAKVTYHSTLTENPKSAKFGIQCVPLGFGLTNATGCLSLLKPTLKFTPAYSAIRHLLYYQAFHLFRVHIIVDIKYLAGPFRMQDCSRKVKNAPCSPAGSPKLIIHQSQLLSLPLPCASIVCVILNPAVTPII